jgi:ssDNA-binding Zn-finger/Zn-ribbon topoisomerase 1
LTAVTPSPPKAKSPPPQSSQAVEPPICPKCGVTMVVRTAGRGTRKGSQFYGCPNFPRCREAVPISGAIPAG